MISIKVKKNTVTGTLNALVKAGEDLTPLMKILGQTGVSRIKMGFKRGVSPNGSGWAPLKARSGQPLRDTGRLMNSTAYKASKDKVFIGTNVFYAATHQFGATIKPSTEVHTTIAGVSSSGAGFLAFKGSKGWVYTKKEITIPARPFLPVDNMPVLWTKAFMRNTTAYIEGIVKANT